MDSELRDEINRILFHILSNEERADKIIELIDAQRCEWTWEKDINLYSTSCGDAWPLAKPFAFCPRCGKRISINEVTHEQGVEHETN